MAANTLVLFCLFAFLLVVSEMAVASRTQPDEMKSKKETVKPNQQGYGYGSNGPIGYGTGPIGYGTGGNNCHYCIRGRNGGSLRCCAHAEEAVQTQHGH